MFLCVSKIFESSIKTENFSNLFGENAALIKRNRICFVIFFVLFLLFTSALLLSCCSFPLWLIKRPRYYFFFSSVFKFVFFVVQSISVCFTRALTSVIDCCFSLLSLSGLKFSYYLTFAIAFKIFLIVFRGVVQTGRFFLWFSLFIGVSFAGLLSSWRWLTFRVVYLANKMVKVSEAKGEHICQTQGWVCLLQKLFTAD